MILRYDKTHRLKVRAVSWHPTLTASGRNRPLLLMLLFLLPVLLFADFEYHSVKQGDTLYGLGKRYGVSVAQIKQLNNLSSDNLSIGQKLKIKEKPKPQAKPKPKPVTSPEPKPAVPAPVTITAPPPPKPAAPVAVATPQPENPGPSPASGQLAVPAQELPKEFYHIVQPGENPYRISQNYGISTQNYFLWNGKQSWDEFDIHPGDKIIIKDPALAKPGSRSEVPPVQQPEAVASPSPATPTVSAARDTVVITKTYTVKPKDTLFSISRANNMTVDEIKRINNLSSNAINVGQVLYLAGTPPSGAPRQSTPPRTEAELEAKDVLRTDLFTPVQGKVVSEFGIRNGKPHKGIDISAKTGTPIYSALDGVVVFSGVQGNYGNVIVVEHPDFVMTVYAHNDQNLVSVNDTVKRGQMIAYIGSTGNATGPHLHFEYRIKGKAINPRKVLSL